MGRAAVTYGGLVQDADKLRVVKDGVVQNVDRALVVCDGVARQFWPRTDFSTFVVTWDTTELTSTDVRVDPLDAQAAIQFILGDGFAYLDNTPPGEVLRASYVSPPIFATEQLLLRWNTVSGTLASNVTENVWFDMFSNGGAFIAAIFLDQTVLGALQASADIDIADDTGGGTPGTIITKRVNFHAEVLDSTDVTMSTLQWDLVHNAIDDDGVCRLELLIDSSVSGYEGPALSRFEQFGAAGGDSSNFTAQLDLISGDAPTGPALATPHTVDETIAWELRADADTEDFTGEYDLTVVGLTNQVTKRVTMHVTRVDDPSFVDPTWATTTDIEEGNLPDSASATLDHNIDGTADFSASGFTPPAGWPRNWHTGAPTPDAENYEVRMESNSPLTGSPLNTWLPANVAYQWVLAFGSPAVQQVSADAQWIYRQIGRPSTEVVHNVSIDMFKGEVP